MVLGRSGYQFQLLGSISCPELPPDRSGLDFHAYSDFLLHMCVHVAILFDENLDVCAAPGALALHAQLSTEKLHFSIMNHRDLRQ